MKVPMADSPGKRLAAAFLVALGAHAAFVISLKSARQDAKPPEISPQAIEIDMLEMVADDAQSTPQEQAQPPAEEPPEPQPPPPEPTPEPPPPPEPEPPMVDPLIEQREAEEKIAKQEEEARKQEQEKERKEAEELAKKKAEQEQARKQQQAAKEAAERAALAKQVSKAPVSRNTPQPQYPMSARQAGIQGTVSIKMKIDLDGSVVGPRVVRSSGNQELDRAAIAAVSKWKYGPAVNRLGKPMAVATTVNVQFKLR